MIDIHCPFDDSVYHAEEAHIGKFILCQKCGARLKIERAGYTPVKWSTQQSIRRQR